jgi:hypothetical protein
LAAAFGISLAVAMAGPAAHAQQRSSLVVDWRLSTTGKPLEREATIRLTDAQGKPVDNAEIEITVDMPSMPMMHRIPKIVARPVGAPGQYSAHFTLEMAGEWAAQIEIKRPQRTRVIKRFSTN